MKNWAGNITYSTNNVLYPTSVQEVQELVKKHKKLRPIGTRHCFNRIADSSETLISLTQMDKIVSLDTDKQTVTVEGGIKYGVLCPFLHQNGLALHNLASLPHISVAGSCATATHGSGVKNGNLATAVTALEIVTANGSIVQLTKDDDGDDFRAAVVGLGGFGVITKVTLSVQPTFLMQQNVYERLPLAQLVQNFNSIMSAGYSVSLFTDWQSESINEVWIKSLVEDGKQNNELAAFYGATAAKQNLHPIADVAAENCTEQMGVPGNWYERLPHFKMGFTPSSGVELQSEYFVAQEHGAAAMLAIQQLGKQIGSHLFISEIRTVAADHLWMSPCYQQDCVALHFTWKQEWEAVSKLLPLIEKSLEPFEAKPHWGKLFTMSPQKLATRYKKLKDFKHILEKYDPDGKFRNDFMETNIFAAE